MIRDHSPHAAFDDLHDYLQKKGPLLLGWIERAGRVAAGVALSDAAIHVIEARLGRRLGTEARLAAAWIVNVSLDLQRSLRGKGDSRSIDQIAYDDAVAIARNQAVARFSGLGPHAAAQLGAVLGHIDEHHL
jgi:hypothetical protein